MIPKTVNPLASELRDGYICGSINGPGTIVLVKSGAPAPTLPSPPSQALQNCMVKTTHILNLRAAPAGEVSRMIPYDVTLTAMARTEGWFQVDYHGESGWISADYVIPEGDCG